MDAKFQSVMQFLNSIHSTWMKFWFGEADARIYALFRITFACAAIANLFDIWPVRHLLLSSDGMIDHDTLMEAIGDRPYFSVFHSLHSQAVVTAILVGSGLAIVCLGLGLFARPAALVVYVWHVSFRHAAFPATNGWDVMLIIYSLLLLISPLGLCWSLPSWVRQGSRNQPVSRIVLPRYGLVLMRYQVILIYLSTFWSKADDQYWRNGEFMSYFMMSIYANFPSAGWAQLRLLSAVMTYAALIMELAIPILFMRSKTRWWAIGLGVMLHGGIALSSHLGIFSLVILSTYTTFLTNQDVDRIVDYARDLSEWISRLVRQSRRSAKSSTCGRSRMLPGLLASLSERDGFYQKEKSNRNNRSINERRRGKEKNPRMCKERRGKAKRR